MALGKHFKEAVARRICETKWKPAYILNLILHLRDVPLDLNTLEDIVDKAFGYFKHKIDMLKHSLIKQLALDDQPSLVYQMLLLSNKGHQMLILKKISDYFNYLDDSLAPVEGDLT